MEEVGDEAQSNIARSDSLSPKLKKTLIAESDFYGETNVKYKLTHYTWALKDFETLVKVGKHIDTKAFTLIDDSNVECFLSADFTDWMSLHITFSSNVPPAYNYEINFHVINEDNLSSFHEVAYVRNVQKGQKVTFEKFLLIEKEELSNFLVNGYLFLLCEISRLNSTFSFRNNSIESMENEISDDMRNLLKNQQLTDVTLVAGGKEFRAHKCVLAARSPVFLAMFQTNMLENKDNEVLFQDTDPECVEKLLQFVYSDEVDNLEDNGERLLILADKYDLKRLKLLCAQELCKSIDTDSAISVLICADKYNVPELKERTLTFIRNQLKAVLETPAYTQLIHLHPNLIKEIFCHDLPSSNKRVKLEL